MQHHIQVGAVRLTGKAKLGNMGPDVLVHTLSCPLASTRVTRREQINTHTHTL